MDGEGTVRVGGGGLWPFRDGREDDGIVCGVFCDVLVFISSVDVAEYTGGKGAGVRK